MPVVSDPGAGLLAAPGPCEWPIDVTCDAAWAGYSDAVKLRATTLAVFVLDALTGRQFAQCPVTVRPCGPACTSFSGYQTFPVSAPSSGVPGPWMTPFVSGGTWRNCVCPGGCDCAPECRVDLRVPVASVTEVRVNGVVLDPAAYELTGRWLARVDGGECWPSCQDPSVPDTEDGTFSVVFSPGLALPVAGQIAAGALASEFARACNGAACGLPAQISSLTRQGVEVEFVDPVEAIGSGRTGIREVDLFVQAVNPKSLAQRPRVYSPDLPRHPVVFP